MPLESFNLMHFGFLFHKNWVMLARDITYFVLFRIMVPKATTNLPRLVAVGLDSAR